MLDIEKSTPIMGTNSSSWSAIRSKNEVLLLHWIFLRLIRPICCYLPSLKSGSLNADSLFSSLSGIIIFAPFFLGAGFLDSKISG